jgi:hypothetical protein
MQDAFDRYEQLPGSYHKDPRWKQISALRRESDKLMRDGNTKDAVNKNCEANGLVFQIRADYGFDG